MIMRNKAYGLIATSFFCVLSWNSYAQFALGAYQNGSNSTQHLSINVTSFRYSEKVTFVAPVLPASIAGLPCKGNLTFQWDFYVNYSYSGQSVGSADNLQSGEDTCTQGGGGSIINIVPGSPINISESFTRQSNSNIVVAGQGQGGYIAGLYIYGGLGSSTIKGNVSFRSWNPTLKFIIKKVGRPPTVVSSPIRNVDQALNKY